MLIIHFTISNNYLDYYNSQTFHFIFILSQSCLKYFIY